MTSQKFDLNMETVLEDWEIQHAIREIIANAMDEQILSSSSPFEINELEEKQWTIRDYGRGLRVEHLTQNENPEKLQNAVRVLGKFGIGLKDALATFHRRGIGVVIRSRHGVFTTVMSGKADFSHILTLHVAVSPPGNPDMKGTEFSLTGVSLDDMNSAKGHFLSFAQTRCLARTEYGEIYDGNKQGGAIWIKGLRVNQEPNFLFSYNITRITKKIGMALNRERSNVGRAAYADRVKDILLGSRDSEVAERLVRDLQEYSTGAFHDECGWLDVQTHACKLLNAQDKKVVFLTPNELATAQTMVDQAKRDGYRIIPVPESVVGKIRGSVDYEGGAIRELETFTRIWNEGFQYSWVSPQDLSLEERQTYEKTEQILRLIGGRPSQVKEVVISETIRPNPTTYQEEVGCWEPMKSLIIIRRDRLRDLGKYASTLLHEAAHAESGASDVTRDFENQLTQYLGRAAEAGNRRKGK